MIVEINLLGEKEKRNVAPFFIFIFLLLLLLGLSLYGFMAYEKSKSELAAAQQKLQSTKQLIQIYEQKANEENASTAIKDLKTTIAWAKTFPTPTVYLIRHLTTLLPQRGFIMNFTYSDDGNLSLTVQTDTNREMAYYLKSLIDAPFLTDVKLTSITTADTELLQSEATNGRVKEKKVEGEYIPRYTGQFQLKVKKEVLKEEAAKEGQKK